MGSPSGGGAAVVHRPAGRDDVGESALVGAGTQHAAHALEVLAEAEAAAREDSDVGVGDVDSLVQYAGSRDGAVAAITEALEDLGALVARDVCRDDRDEEVLRDRI